MSFKHWLIIMIVVTLTFSLASANDFNCSASNEPYLKEKIDYTCELPNGTEEWSCINTVSYNETDILQANPQKVERTQGGLVQLMGVTESRETFNTNNNLLIAYYTNKNLLSETNFTINTVCSDGTNTYTNSFDITPVYRDLDTVTNRAVWLNGNWHYVALAFFFLILLIFLLGVLWRARK